MTTPFLHQIAQTFYARYGNSLHQHVFVFPNRRAGVFFQKYIAEIAEKPVFSPTILTIQELFERLSPYQTADRIELLVLLYELYSRISRSEDTFDDFVYWGEMLLNDFNDVDKYLVDAQQLFRNIKDLREMDGDTSYLNPEQIKAIQRFWENFMPVGDNVSKKNFQETWEILFELYTAFRETLQSKGLAYEGMLFREVAERVKNKKDVTIPYSSIVFVGLNALTYSEKLLLERLHNLGIADFYWDYDSPWVNDPNNKASFWVEENRWRFPSKFELPDTESDLQQRPSVEVIAVPSAVGQAKQVTEILSDLIKDRTIDPEKAIHTAIVLPDESLLLPTLCSIPEEFNKINVTMGYGLHHASIAGLMEHVADLQRNIRPSEEGSGFYFRFVLAILNHSLIQLAIGDEANEWKDAIVKNNRIIVYAQDIPEHPLLRLIFQPIEDWRQLGDYLQQILQAFYKELTHHKQDTETESEQIRSIDLEREFIVQYYKCVTRLKDALSDSTNMLSATYFRLLKRITQNISVPFNGEPLSGLQVMGVLETRAIDFENLIILSMNEGVFPLKNPSNSFIPYSLRKAFELPTYEHQDSTYAYHFYRMISRAKRIYLLYDTRTEEMQTGEASRYIHQLKYLYQDMLIWNERVVSYHVAAPETAAISVTKSPEILEKLHQFTSTGDRFLSASLINNYINCPLQFYFMAVEGLGKEEEIQESVESSVFGSIYHRVMEKIYNRLATSTITADALDTVKKDDALLTRLIEGAFARAYFKDENNPKPLKGHHYLIGEIIRSYVKQTLTVDASLTPFEYVASEYRFQQVYRVNNSLSVRFKGSIDRIDRIGETLRIIDYKTGQGKTDIKELASLFANHKERPSAALQAFIYGFFYEKENPNQRISPQLYFLRQIYGDFDSNIYLDKQRVDDISEYLPEFKALFDPLLEEIFNPEIPFCQTTVDKPCGYCPFKDVCGR